MAMSIDSFANYDKYVSNLIFHDLEIEQYLEEIQISSLKSFIRAFFMESKNSKLSSSKIQNEQLNQYLTEVHTHAANTLNESKEINSSKTIKELAKNIEISAENAGLKNGNLYIPPVANDIIPMLIELNQAINSLDVHDRFYIGKDTQILVNKDRIISKELIRKDMTARTIETEKSDVYPLKKPDLLGISMWEFQDKKHIINVKIMDEEWLLKVQSGAIPIIAGTRVRAKFKYITHLDEKERPLSNEIYLMKFEEFIPRNGENEELYGR